jgi:hypothetical protein
MGYSRQKSYLSECWGIYVGRIYWRVSGRADNKEPDAFEGAYVKLDQGGNKSEW